MKDKQGVYSIHDTDVAFYSCGVIDNRVSPPPCSFIVLHYLEWMKAKSDAAPQRRGVPSAEPPSASARIDILMNAGLFARDPISFPGLAKAMDPEAGIDPAFKPIAYDTRQTTGEKVPCSICPQKQAHFDGAIVRLRDGKAGLVGNECGKRHFFGDDGWVALQGRMRIEEDRAIFLARFGPAKQRIDEIVPLLAQWERSLKEVAKFRQQFRANLPKLFKGVARELRGGYLSVEESVRVPYRERDGGIGHRIEARSRKVCKIDALWFFKGQEAHLEVPKIRAKMINALGYLRAEASAANVQGVRRILQECRRGLDDLSRLQAQLIPLTTARWVEQLVSWANAALQDRGHYSAAGVLVTRDGSGEAASSINFAEIPSDLSDAWEQIKALWPSL